MRDNYQPPDAPWERRPGPRQSRSWQAPRSTPSGRAGWPLDDDFAGAGADDGASAARGAGLRRLSTLTWRTAQLSAITAVGFAALFSRTAQTRTAAGSTTLPATTPPVSPSPSPAPSTPTPSASPNPTLAPPATAPAPPPPPPATSAPATTSGGSGN